MLRSQNRPNRRHTFANLGERVVSTTVGSDLCQYEEDSVLIPGVRTTQSLGAEPGGAGVRGTS